MDTLYSIDSLNNENDYILDRESEAVSSSSLPTYTLPSNSLSPDTITQLGFVKQKLQLLTCRSILPKSNDVPTIYEDELNYDQNSPIGFGSFGVVFKANWNGRIVARKKSIHNVHSDDVAKMIIKESEIWKSLKHENIVSLLAVSVNTDRPFLVMPFMSNGALFDYINRNPATPANVRVKFMCDVAHGLKYLHENNVVHGDIKADNLLLDENLNCFIADFSLSSKVTNATNSKQSKSKNTGALRFAAPEK